MQRKSKAIALLAAAALAPSLLIAQPASAATDTSLVAKSKLSGSTTTFSGTLTWVSKTEAYFPMPALYDGISGHDDPYFNVCWATSANKPGAYQCGVQHVQELGYGKVAYYDKLSVKTSARLLWVGVEVGDDGNNGKNQGWASAANPYK